MAQTLLLNPDTWDLTVDSSGNIAVADVEYSLAQDAASACKTFQGELYYDTTQGIPYWQQILGKWPPLSLVRAHMIRAAMTVPGVIKSKCFFTKFEKRALSGQVQVTDANGKTTAANF
jgi:hypothetical protein